MNVLKMESVTAKHILLQASTVSPQTPACATKRVVLHMMKQHL